MKADVWVCGVARLVSIGGGWQGGPPPGVPNPAGSRPGSSLPFSQLASQPGTPLDLRFVSYNFFPIPSHWFDSIMVAI